MDYQALYVYIGYQLWLLAMDQWMTEPILMYVGHTAPYWLCLLTPISLCEYTYTDTYIHMHIYIYIYMYIYIYVCVCVFVFMVDYYGSLHY